MTTQQHYCYILFNKTNNCTYNGYTTDLTRRLRQHNKQLAGGARYTTTRCKPGFAGWEYLAHVTSTDPSFDKKKALSLEWHIKYPNNRRPRPAEFTGAQGRLKGLSMALQNPKFQGITFDIWTHPSYAILLNNDLIPAKQDLDLISIDSKKSIDA